jgi:nucleoid-associated protein YgaU
MWKRIFLSILLAGSLTACAKNIPEEVTDFNRALNQAMDACATVYAADELAALQPRIDAMNQLVADKKYKNAGREAAALQSELDAVIQAADEGRSAARRRAETAIDRAEGAMETARNAEAEEYARADFNAASSKLNDARRLNRDPCKAAEAAAAAEEAMRMGNRAAETAMAEARRLEAERRRAEEEARRLEEERRRREEELRQRPPSYAVQRGDNLWNIAAMDPIFSDPLLWPAIYMANKEQVSNPDMIFPGQNFKIPRDKSVENLKRECLEFFKTYEPETMGE